MTIIDFQVLFTLMEHSHTKEERKPALDKLMLLHFNDKIIYTGIGEGVLAIYTHVYKLVAAMLVLDRIK